MQRLLRQHGFNIEEMYGDFAPPGEVRTDSESVVFVCTKESST